MGSFFADGAKKESGSHLLVNGFQLTSGRIVLLALSLVTREPMSVSMTAVSVRSAWALVSIPIFGSLVVFSLYTWLFGEGQHWAATFA